MKHLKTLQTIVEEKNYNFYHIIGTAAVMTFTVPGLVIGIAAFYFAQKAE